VDAVHERDAEAHGACAESQRDDGQLSPAHGQDADERTTDTQVAVDGNGDHDQQRERDVAGDQKLHTAVTPTQHSLQQFAVRLKNSRLVILPVQAVAEDIFIWTAGPRRIVNSINWAV